MRHPPTTASPLEACESETVAINRVRSSCPLSARSGDTLSNQIDRFRTFTSSLKRREHHYARAVRAKLGAIAVVLVSVPAAAFAGVSSSGNLTVRAGYDNVRFGYAFDVEAEVQADHGVGVVLEADEFPYDGSWLEIARGTTDPATRSLTVKQKPAAVTRYRATNLENGYQAETEVPLQLRKVRRSTCPKDPSSTKRFRCAMRADVYAPQRIVGHRVQLSVYNSKGRLVRRITKRLRKVSGSLLRANFRYRSRFSDGIGLCLLDIRGDGFAHNGPSKTRDCDFDLS